MPDPTPLRLWPAAAPLAVGDADLDVPQIVLHKPRDVGVVAGCVLVCPGGGYQGLSPHEGEAVGAFLASRGVAAAVLRYRLAPRYQHPAPLLDAARALRTLRHRARELNIDPDRLAVMGFSAGGHVASTLATHFDAGDAGAADPVERVSSRPDLAVLCYPVITMRDPHAHAGSRRNLLGDRAADPAMLARLSTDERVTADAPPTFLFHTADDDAVDVENALRYAAALRRRGVPFALHVFERGPHGAGLAAADPRLSGWSDLLVAWLRGHGW